MAGLDAATRDPAEIAAHAGYLPQRPGSLLFCERVEQELAFTLRHRRGGRDPEATLAALGLAALADAQPARPERRANRSGRRWPRSWSAIRGCSSSTSRRAAWTTAASATSPRFLRARRGEGVAIVMATHDVELVAECATRVVLLGEGEIVADGTPRDVLSGSLTFATQINKLLGGSLPDGR